MENVFKVTKSDVIEIMKSNNIQVNEENTEKAMEMVEEYFQVTLDTELANYMDYNSERFYSKEN